MFRAGRHVARNTSTAWKIHHTIHSFFIQNHVCSPPDAPKLGFWVRLVLLVIICLIRARSNPAVKNGLFSNLASSFLTFELVAKRLDKNMVSRDRCTTQYK